MFYTARSLVGRGAALALHIGGDVLDEIDIAGDMSAALTVGGHFHAALECDGTADDIALLGTGEDAGSRADGQPKSAHRGSSRLQTSDFSGESPVELAD